MDNKLMYIPNDDIQNYPSVDQWLKRFDTQYNEQTYQTRIKVPKGVKPTNKKQLLENFEDQCI